MGSVTVVGRVTVCKQIFAKEKVPLTINQVTQLTDIPGVTGITPLSFPPREVAPVTGTPLPGHGL